MLRPASVLLAALVAVALLSHPPRGGRFADRSLIPNPLPVKLLAKSHLSLATDLYWIRMAALAASARTPPEGLALIEWGRFVTTLDPRMMWAYGVGGLLGPIRQGDQVYNVAEAVDLLERGTRAVPQDFRLHLYLAYTQLDLQGDLVAAGHTLERAVGLPRAPAYLGPLAARLLAEGGQFEAAREFARQMAASDDPMTRETFRQRLLEIDREEAWTTLEAAVRTYLARQGHPPARLEDLVRDGVLEAIPADPLGAAFVLQPDGGVGVTSGERLRIHRQGAQR